MLVRPSSREGRYALVKVIDVPHGQSKRHGASPFSRNLSLAKD